MLQDTIICETIWPCMAYALRRIGKPEYINFEYLNSGYQKDLQEYDEDQTYTYPVGLTILVWKLDLSKCKLPVQITADGQVICRIINYQYHCGVMEMGNLVSQLERLDSSSEPLPFTIKLTPLSDMRHKPDYYICLK